MKFVVPYEGSLLWKEKFKAYVTTETFNYFFRRSTNRLLIQD